MPKAFLQCVKDGGKVRRISGPNKDFGLKKGEYRNICWDKKGESYLGEVHKKKTKENLKRKTKKLITPSDIPHLLKPGMKVINPKKKKKKEKPKRKKKSKNLSLKNITYKSLKNIDDKSLLTIHHNIHNKWKNKDMKKITIKSIVISHVLIRNEFKKRGLIHYKKDSLDY